MKGGFAQRQSLWPTEKVLSYPCLSYLETYVLSKRLNIFHVYKIFWNSRKLPCLCSFSELKIIHKTIRNIFWAEVLASLAVEQLPTLYKVQGSPLSILKYSNTCSLILWPNYRSIRYPEKLHIIKAIHC